jgi:hypothetical protein
MRYGSTDYDPSYIESGRYAGTAEAKQRDESRAGIR